MQRIPSFLASDLHYLTNSTTPADAAFRPPVPPCVGSRGYWNNFLGTPERPHWRPKLLARCTRLPSPVTYRETTRGRAESFASAGSSKARGHAESLACPRRSGITHGGEMPRCSAEKCTTVVVKELAGSYISNSKNQFLEIYIYRYPFWQLEAVSSLKI